VPALGFEQLVDDGVAAAARLTEHEQVVTFVGDIEPQVHRADCAGVDQRGVELRQLVGATEA
jgi:hypothetical protein